MSSSVKRPDQNLVRPLFLNSDAEIYVGSNTGNGGSVRTESIGAHGHLASLSLSIPPLGVLVLGLED